MAQAEAIRSTSRRNFLAAAAVSTAIMAPGVAAANIDPIAKVDREFEAAREAFSRACLMVDSEESDAAANEEYERSFRVVCEIVDRIAGTKATNIAMLRLKARALAWCNDELDFMKSDSSDQCLARGIIQDLLALPTV